ncbi:MAG: NAD-dependent epimerase/dehydratase family protein [Myxococcota bacterium]
MKPIAVFGASGFVGSHVVAELLDRGHPVRAALRNPDGPARAWLESALGPRGTLTLHQADLTDEAAIREAVRGCDGIVMSAGSEAQQPSTIDLMVGAARNTLNAAHAEGIGAVVFTSSTGSTNPPGGEPDVKREMEHFSDPDQQIAAGKYSPAAKTLMEREAMALGEAHDIRVSIVMPSMILGDGFGPPPAYLAFLRRILDGEVFGGGVPNDSMSLIHVDDLARLHVAALTNPAASGRYFGLVQSWHWQDVLEALARHVPSYEAPPWPDDRPRARPTQFDPTRRDALGVGLRGIDAIFADVEAVLRCHGIVP